MTTAGPISGDDTGHVAEPQATSRPFRRSVDVTPWREVRAEARRRRGAPLERTPAERRAALRRCFGLDLAAARRRRALTQTDLAERLGTTQFGVSHLERQGDMKLSTLHEYVEATGGRLRVTAEYPDDTVDLHTAVDPVDPAPPARYMES